jgi:hypothetical protein
MDFDDLFDSRSEKVTQVKKKVTPTKEKVTLSENKVTLIEKADQIKKKVTPKHHDPGSDRLGGSIPEELVHDAYEKIAKLETRFANQIHDFAYKLDKLQVDLHEKEFTVVSDESTLTLDTLFSLIKDSDDINGKMLKEWCFEQEGKYRKRNEDRYKRIVTALYVFLKELNLLS